jgi:hypothetical protein
MKTHFLGWLLVSGIAVADPLAPPHASDPAPPAVAMLSRLPEAPSLKASDLQPRVENRTRPAVPPLPPQARVEAEPLVEIRPDSDGVLDESAVATVEDPDGATNPFRIRYRPPLPMQDLRLGIDSILIGAGGGRNTAVINGRPYSAGDELYGLRLSAVSEETVDLRHGNLLLRLPVQDKPITLRLPRLTGNPDNP